MRFLNEQCPIFAKTFIIEYGGRSPTMRAAADATTFHATAGRLRYVTE